MRNVHFQFCFLAFTLVLAIISCKSDNENVRLDSMNGKKVFSANVSDELSAFGDMELDSLYPNLLDPTVSGDSIESVMNSWMLLHQAISTQLDRSDFSWETSDSIIAILHKVYFNKSGKIDYYFFKVFNESVSDSVVSAFAVELDSFTNNYLMQLEVNRNYAQCGKTSYMNHSPKISHK